MDMKNPLVLPDESYGKLVQAARDYYQSHKHKLSDAKSAMVCMGDLNPANILVCDQEVYLTDFEWFGVDNDMYDIAFYWLFLWKYPDWQKSLTRRYVLSELDEENFRLNIIRITLSCPWWNRFERFRVKYNIMHPWVRYPVAAAESFKALMEVK